MSVNDWYSSFVSNRPVEMKRSVARSKKISFYSMFISKLSSPEVHENIRYQVSAFLYDPKTSQMFGRQCRTVWKRAQNGVCVFNEALYFYSVISDKDLLLIIEFVEEGAGDIKEASSVGWFQRRVEKRQVAEISEPRVTEVYGGTPKLLIFDKEMITRPVGSVECTYKHHEMPPIFSQCLPEFCIVSNADFIPGIQKDSDDQWWLSTPKEMLTIPAAIDSIAIQFKNSVSELERQILSDIEREWGLKEGGSSRKPKAVIMDRRLRIGVHNGFTYVTEPFTVDLEIIDANAGGTLRSRKKPIDLGNAAKERLVFQAAGNPRLALRNLFADPHMAIIFLLEYTFHREDNQSLSQTVLIGWAAWTPFSDGIFSGKEVDTRVSFVGGPRPNPEGVLCYKNVLSQPDSTRPLNEKLEVFVDFKFYENGKSVHNTPTPRRAAISNQTESATHSARAVEPKTSEKKEPISHREEEIGNSSRFPPLESGRSISSVDDLKAGNADLDRFLEEFPVEVREVTEKAVEETRPLNSVYKIPFEEMKTTDFPRKVHTMFARQNFVQIKDRHGGSPTHEDVTQKGIVDLNRERLDRLDTSHVFFQFVAFKQLASPDAAQLHKVFFTVNLFRFPELNTESMLLTPMEKGEPSLLTRLDQNGGAVDSPGFIAKYVVEGEEEKNDFLEFLVSGHACIDVWDSDSLIHYGSTIVPLRNLLRRGREAVQLYLQCPIVETALGNGSKTIALLYLRAVNVGFPSVNGYDPSSAAMAATTGSSASSASSNRGTVVRRLTSSIRLNEEGPHSYRIHAKPLSGNGGLDRFVTAQRLDVQQRHEELFNERSLEKIRQWNELKNEFKINDNREVAQKFIFEEELAAYKKLRYESKPAKLLEAVFKGITTCHTIRPAFGEKVFFEFPLENFRSEPVYCSIEFDDEALRPVFDEEEWKVFKTVNKLNTPLERDMLRQTADRVELCLQPGETLFVPFIYDAFFFPNDHFGMYSSKIVFRRWDTREPLAILDLHVHHRSFLLQHSAVFMSETSCNWQKQLVLPPMPRDRRVSSCRCSDPSVNAKPRNDSLQQIIEFHTYSGETNDQKTFLLLMYSDHYQTRLLATWKITILPLFKVYFRGIVGQTTRVFLPIQRKSDHGGVPDDLLNVYASSGSMKVVDSALTERNPAAKLDFTPSFVGEKQFVVSIVNSNTRKFEQGFLISAVSEEPRITQKYVLQIPASDEAVRRKFPIRNPYNLPKNFLITAAPAETVQISVPVVSIPPQGKATCEVYFVRNTHLQRNIEALIFISDADTNVQEEAYSLLIAFEALP